MVTVIITHEVKDFAEWKKGFDADEPNRANAGIKTGSLYTAFENSNLVTVIFDAPNADVVNGMLRSPELQEAMKNAGVISAPEVKILNRI